MERISSLSSECHNLYLSKRELTPYHGWHHVEFVRRKSVLFASDLDADAVVVGAAALTHDLNYFLNPKSSAAAGAQLRERMLTNAGFKADRIKRIEECILSAEITVRGSDLSPEAMALSDGDSLFKALPVTPIIFSSRYIEETGFDLREVAERIVREQKPLLDNSIYFYSDTARANYTNWAATNVQLWCNVLSSLDDADVAWALGEVQARDAL